MINHFKIKYAILQTILFTIIGASGEYANDLKKEPYTGKISVKLRRIFKPGFNQPLDMAVFPEKIKGETYYAVAEKRGVVYLVTQKGSENKNIKIVLLDLRKKVCSEGFEQGLLGIAFDPDYKKTHEMFIYYCDCRPNKTILSRVKITSGIKNELPFFEAAESKILEIAQPYSNHKGGHVEFGPDGYLYIGVGDGGSAGDPHGNGQNINTLLGKILRIDVQ